MQRALASRLVGVSGALLIVASGLAPGIGCGDKDDSGSTGTIGTTDGGTTDGGTAGDGGTTEPDPISATITGTVTVKLYDYQTGDEVSWDDMKGSFPFGGIYVAGYQQPDLADPIEYVGDTAIGSPNAGVDGDSYELPVVMMEDGTVQVYAALDWNGDTIIGTTEPRGVFATPLEITDGASHSGIDLEIVAPVNTGGGGGCGTGTIDIIGDVVLTSSWVDGDVAAMTLTTAGEGPIHSTRATPEPDGAGASAPYAITSCADEGERNLVGAWDSNGNDLFDPSDLWGTYTPEPDVDGNPITVGAGTLTGYDLTVPYGEGRGLSIVPFVTVSGTLSWTGGSFDDLPDGSVIYGMALKFRPEGETIVADTETYDSETWEVADYAGKSELDWELLVPANSVVFLWFYADIDGDGVVNEYLEPVASAGDDGDGRFPTGSTSTEGYPVQLDSVK